MTSKSITVPPKARYYFEGHVESVWTTIYESTTMTAETKVLLQAILKHQRKLSRCVLVWLTIDSHGGFELNSEGYRTTDYDELMWCHKESGQINA